MKKINYLFLIIVLLIGTKVFSQEMIDVIQMKNGDILKGLIIENVPNDYVKIELQGGSVLTVKYVDVSKFRKERKNIKSDDNESVQIEKQNTAKKADSQKTMGLFKSNEKVLQIGIGYGLMGIYGDVKIPPVSASLDFASISDKITFGAFVGYSSSQFKTSIPSYKVVNYYPYYIYTNVDYGWDYSYLILGARGAYHFLDEQKMDAYVGLLLGYNVVSASAFGDLPTSVSASANYVIYGFYLGGRYAFSEKIGVFGELGYGAGYITVGAFFKF
jgi:hypothetical protein